VGGGSTQPEKGAAQEETERQKNKETQKHSRQTRPVSPAVRHGTWDLSGRAQNPVRPQGGREKGNFSMPLGTHP
jgi:hypothetical protein